ncbi:MAG: C-terminal binding protein [Gemmataceae bacterium]|nr:C-terminal binding protein [Gemmataceae bacterium]
MGQKPLVVVTDHLAEAGVEKPVLEGIADLLLLQTGEERVVQERGTGADILLVYHDIRLTAATVESLPRCKAIIRCGVGVDNVDLQAAGRNGIVVCNVPDYGTEEVADHALMSMLAIARRLVPSHEAIREGRWDVTTAFGTPRMRGKTLGIVGCGRIGTAMARRGLALGMRVVFFDPNLPDGVDKALGVERVYTLEELLPQSEFLSLHCPLNASTRHLLNDRTLALLPKGAYVVNTARGGVIDGRALVASLDAGHVAYAALDVVEREPLDDEAIRQHPRLLLTPHSAFYSVEAFNEMRTKGAMEARRVIRGEAVRNPVNLGWLTNPRAAIKASGTA